ncbi:MAG: class I SAM-dependent methyltransferase [Algoriphagus sp.]|nr:class I SAM-dependent methyltransferase [Algoriphagus sp.]
MSFITDLFASSDNPKSLGAKFRNRRLHDFEALIFKNFSPDQPLRILDVGGTAYFWKNSSLPNLKQIEIVLLNLQEEQINHPTIRSVSGDATSMPEFAQKSFDIVFSNSVIEHLYTLENQKKMADEILRVGKKYFIQTPNRNFPIEAHYALPFAQFLPKNVTYFLLTKTKLSRLKKWEPRDAQQYLDEIRLLDEGQLRKLFPQAEIYKEKVFGLVKSIAAHNLS